MAYNGTLFSISGAKFPLKYIFRESYHVTPHALDLDSTRTTTGHLQRNVLSHKSCTVSFETKPMRFDEYDEMWEFIRSRYISTKEKDVNCAYYNFETGHMESMHAYIPDVEHAPDLVRGRDGIMMSTTLEFIGY